MGKLRFSIRGTPGNKVTLLVYHLQKEQCSKTCLGGGGGGGDNNYEGLLYLERYLCVFIQEHTELTDTYPEVAISELVGDIETQSSKLPPLQRNTVKHTEGE